MFIPIETENLTDEEIMNILDSNDFEKIALVSEPPVTEEALQLDNSPYPWMVLGMTKAHSQIESEEITNEFIMLLFEWIKAHSDPLNSGRQGAGDGGELNDSETTAAETVATTSDDELIEYLERQLDEAESLENVKASALASDIDHSGREVGTKLAKWRDAADAPFAVSSSEGVDGTKRWRIEKEEKTSHM